MSEISVKKEIPLLFKPEAFKAVLKGRKTQTRRVLKVKDQISLEGIKSWHQDGGNNWIGWTSDLPELADFTKKAYPNGEGIACPYGTLGDRYYLLEPTQIIRFGDTHPEKVLVRYPYNEEFLWMQITDKDLDLIQSRKDWTKPAIARFMLKSFARHWCECVSVRAERLQDISEEDAIAEGVEKHPQYDHPDKYISYAKPFDLHYFCWGARESFKTLWDSINEKRGYSWNSNPWVWVIEFKSVNFNQEVA